MDRSLSNWTSPLVPKWDYKAEEFIKGVFESWKHTEHHRNPDVDLIFHRSLRDLTLQWIRLNWPNWPSVIVYHLSFWVFELNLWWGARGQSRPASKHVCMHMYFVHTYEYIYAEMWSIWILRALQVSHPDPWAHIREYPTCSVCVCVCVYTHLHSHTLPPPSKNRENTDNTSIFPWLCKKQPPTPGTSALHTSKKYRSTHM